MIRNTTTCTGESTAYQNIDISTVVWYGVAIVVVVVVIVAVVV